MDKELFKQMSGDARRFQPGDRVRLVKMNDPYVAAPEHTVGTVTAVAPPPINVLCVKWDNGFGLNPCLDEDVVGLYSEGVTRISVERRHQDLSDDRRRLTEGDVE